MYLRRQIKHNARKALAGAWGKSITVLFILAVIIALFTQFEAVVYQVIAWMGVQSPILGRLTVGSVAIDVSAFSLIVTALGTIFGFFLMIPLMMGLVRWYYRLSDGVQEDVTAVFHYFSNVRQLLRCWAIAFLLSFLFLFWMSLFVAPGAITLFLSVDLSAGARDSLDNVASTFGLIVGLALLAVGIVCLSILLQRYKLAPYLLVVHPDWPILRCIRMSVRTMKGHMGEAWMLHLSFFPWFALCLLAIPILFVIPYCLQSHAIYAHYRIERAEQRKQSDGDTQVFERVEDPHKEDRTVGQGPFEPPERGDLEGGLPV